MDHSELGVKRGLHLLAVVLVSIAAAGAVWQEEPGKEKPHKAGSEPPVVFVRVELPIEREVDDDVVAEITRRLRQLEPSAVRPLVVIEFRARDPDRASKSRFEDSLSLARFLSGPKLRRARTIAYLPQTVQGHAVLAVLACEQLVVHPQAELGAAGIAEPALDPTVRRAYAEIADRRRTIPEPVALAMLDPNVVCYEVELADGSRRFVLEPELKKLRADGQVIREDALGKAGTPLMLDATALETRYGFAAHQAASLADLAAALGVSPALLRDDPSQARRWRAVRLSLTGILDSGKVKRAIRRIETVQHNDRRVDLLFVVLDSPGGEPAAALELAHFLARQSKLRTVAVVTHEARSVSALPAIACDELYVSEDAVLGGDGSVALSQRELGDIRESVQELAELREIDWSLPMALVDPKLAVYRFDRVNGVGQRYLCDEEHRRLSEPDDWRRGAAIDIGEDGITGERAVRLGLARQTVKSFSEVAERFGVDPRKISEAKGQWLVETVQTLGAQPWLARTLLFIAFFALISEASSPGLGIAGFVSAVCFLLFFWASFLNGTAGWLEVILFLGGLIFLAAEVFLIPGFGVFGIGGAVMLLASLVLAAQTFIVPHNSYQLRILARSLWLVAAAGCGVLGGIWVVSRYLHRIPVLSRLMLSPPSEEQAEIQQQRELPVSYQHLIGRTGVAVTPLVPGGKAEFGEETVPVISEGDLIEKGSKVLVVDVVGPKVIVVAAE